MIGETASQRVKSEAETRYLIDEQLRKVGWEADTENLRYSMGTRPAKGHNMAIAGWPTDSTVGSKGYADYALFAGTQMVAVIEAKAIHKDIPSVIDYQCKDYSSNIRKEDADYQVGIWDSIKCHLLLLPMEDHTWNNWRLSPVFVFSPSGSFQCT